MRSIRVILPLLFAFILGTGCSSCGLPLSNSNGESNNATQNAGENATTDAAIDWTPECERLGYPCTLGDVDSAVADRTDALGERAFSELWAGDSAEAVAASLHAEEDVVDIAYDAGTVSFRVADGRRAWVLGPDSESLRFYENLDGPADSQTRTQGLEYDVVHHGDNQPGPKSALLLAPAYSDFDGPKGVDHAEAQLSQLTEYGTIEMRTATPATLGDFLHWENYDVIHLLAHGQILCVEESEYCLEHESGECTVSTDVKRVVKVDRDGSDFDTKDVAYNGDEPCFGFISPEIVLDDSVDDDVYEAFGADVLYAPPRIHTRVCGADAETLQPDRFVLLSRQFFKKHYGPGNALDDRIIALSSCYSAFKGRNQFPFSGSPVVLGWSESIANSHDQKMYQTLYDEMVTNFMPADFAYEEIQAQGLDTYQGSSCVGDGTYDSQLVIDGARPLWIRENVRIVDENGNVYENGFDITSLKVADDPKTLKVGLALFGLWEENPSGYTFHLEVNGREVGETWTLDDATSPTPGVFVVQDEVQLDRNVDDLERPVELKTWVDFPEGGKTVWNAREAPSGAYWRADVTGAMEETREYGSYVWSYSDVKNFYGITFGDYGSNLFNLIVNIPASFAEGEHNLVDADTNWDNHSSTYHATIGWAFPLEDDKDYTWESVDGTLTITEAQGKVISGTFDFDAAPVENDPDNPGPIHVTGFFQNISLTE